MSYFYGENLQLHTRFFTTSKLKVFYLSVDYLDLKTFNFEVVIFFQDFKIFYSSVDLITANYFNNDFFFVYRETIVSF